jgi:hypothetical protein
LVDPSLNAGELVGWVGRGEPLSEFDRDEKSYTFPKWLKKHDKVEGRDVVFFLRDYKSSHKPLVFVEDVPSAIRVYEAFNCEINVCALLGTSVTTSLLMKLKEYRMYFWLDADAEQKAIKYWKKALVLGMRAGYIKSTLDPKKYSNASIRDLMSIHSFPSD